MAQQFDILIRNARLRNNKDQLFDIGVENGKNYSNCRAPASSGQS